MGSRRFRYAVKCAGICRFFSVTLEIFSLPPRRKSFFCEGYFWYQTLKLMFQTCKLKFQTLELMFPTLKRKILPEGKTFSPRSENKYSSMGKLFVT